jgi:hypothetical protein
MKWLELLRRILTWLLTSKAERQIRAEIVSLEQQEMEALDYLETYLRAGYTAGANTVNNELRRLREKLDEKRKQLAEYSGG